jgi:hypothetical protein
MLRYEPDSVHTNTFEPRRFLIAARVHGDRYRYAPMLNPIKSVIAGSAIGT